jgi:hypothetical protein
MGPFPVTIAWTKNPNMENMASLHRVRRGVNGSSKPMMGMAIEYQTFIVDI